MRTVVAASLLFLAAAVTVAAAERIERTALLILPNELSTQPPFRPEVEFRWDEKEPLRISTYTRNDRQSTLGEIHVFDEHGKEVQMFYPVSIRRVPNAERTVKKGEVLRIGLDLAGWPIFERAGSYYAIATFSSAWCGESNVRFTTKKRWFRVGAPAKNV